MRDSTVNRTTLALVVAIVLVATLFAWSRSRSGSGAPTGGTGPPGPAASESVLSELARRGEVVYAEECGFCHGTDAGELSSLAGFVERVSGAEGGAVYLVDFLLYGLEGEVQDEPAHPPFDHLTDTEIAGVIDYLRGAGAPAAEAAGPLVSPVAVEARRVLPVDPEELSVRRRRVLDSGGQD